MTDLFLLLRRKKIAPRFSRRHFRGEPKDKTRTNGRIRAFKLRVIAANGDQLGIITRNEALDIAREDGLDLVEVAPNADPPVAKIMDYGKFKYQQEKRAKESKKKAHTVTVKEVKLRPKIGKNDLDFKMRHATEFLGEGNKVKVTMQFRGREIAYSDLGKDILEQIIKDFEEIAVPENAPKMEGRNMAVILAPKKAVEKKK